MNEKNPYLIPGAIVISGLIIAVAVIYSIGGFPFGNKKPAGTAAIGELPAVSSTDFVLGDKNAPVTVIEYGDFQCPFCAKYFRETEPVLREKYIKTGKVKFIYRDFAFLGQESLWSANAAHCAGEQGKFWEMHDYLYANQKGENLGTFSKDNLKKFAGVLGLNAASFGTCLDSDKYFNTIQESTKAGGEAGVSGTPASFVNGTLYAGALPVNNFTKIIDAELSKLGK